MKYYVPFAGGQYVCMASSPVMAVVRLWRRRANELRETFASDGLSGIALDRLGIQPSYRVHQGQASGYVLVRASEVVQHIDPDDFALFVAIVGSVHGLGAVKKIQEEI